MNIKDNQRTRLSKKLLRDAFIDLIKEKGSVKKISVRELCEKAELNRSTFYAHYDTPEDLLDEIENDIIDAAKDYLVKIGLEKDAEANKYILSFLRFIKDNDKTFRVLLVDSTDNSFRNRFMQQSILQFIDNMQITVPKELEQYIFSYILHGSTGIIIQWIRSDYSADDMEIVNLLYSINFGALMNYANK